MRVYVVRVKWWYVFAVLVLAFVSLVPQVREPLIVTVTSRGRLVPIYKVSTGEKKLAISFDATWGTELTDELLAILDEHDYDHLFPGGLPRITPDYVVKMKYAGHEIGVTAIPTPYEHPERAGYCL